MSTLIKTQKFELLWNHLQQHKKLLEDAFEFAGHVEDHPQMEIHFQGMVIWMDFREIGPTLHFWGIRFEELEVHQQKEHEFEFMFNEGYQKCFEEDQAFFDFLDTLLRKTP